MDRGATLYEKIYGILKNRIESGLLSNGSRLPSRRELCLEFGISGKTARRAIDMLAGNGLVRTNRRKRATVNADGGRVEPGPASFRKANAVYADEILKSGVLLCYPLVAAGIARCSPADWDIPGKIYAGMNPDRPAGFWQRSNRIWRFFIARNGNDIALRAVDSLGLSEIDPLPGTGETRARYRQTLGEFLHKARAGENTDSVAFEDLSYLYGFAPGRKKSPTFSVSPESPLYAGAKAIERRFSGAEMRYSAVYMDILGMINAGRYKPGDRLPSHKELCEAYGVSVDTTIKAIGVLRAWGAVTAKRGRGIYVAADTEGLKAVRIAPELIAGHVRRYLDSLELLSLTVEGVAAHAASRAGKEEGRQLKNEMTALWENDYRYLRSPWSLLRFISERIEYDALKTIYAVLVKNYHIGRSVPKLVTRRKSPLIREINSRCLETAAFLEAGDPAGFAKSSAQTFGRIHRLVLAECAKFGYLEPALNVYDGSSLWEVKP